VKRRNLTRALAFSAGLICGAAGIYVSICARVVPVVEADALLTEPTLPPPPPPVEIHVADEDLHALLRRQLILPIAGFDPALLSDSFTTPRPGRKTHEAIDIPARRGTPIHAADDGYIEKLAVSPRGGISIYQFDPAGVYCYFYAHLDRYANRIKPGLRVRRGDIIGYVGSTGDARASGPHLHFSITRLGPEKHWWEGAPINPYPVFAGISIRHNAADPGN